MAAKYRVQRVVFASSNHVTGLYESEQWSEAHPACIKHTVPPRPDGYYGISKLCGEGIARYFSECHDVEAVCLRIGTVLKSDDPSKEARHRSTWLSKRDLTELVRRALLAGDTFGGFGIYYGVSNNARRFWDIENARNELGFEPRDDAETRFDVRA